MININLQAAKSPWNSQTATSETGITFPRLFQGLFFVWRPVMKKILYRLYLRYLESKIRPKFDRKLSLEIDRITEKLEK